MSSLLSSSNASWQVSEQRCLIVVVVGVVDDGLERAEGPTVSLIIFGGGGVAAEKHSQEKKIVIRDKLRPN
jgi:hypothetical protein